MVQNEFLKVLENGTKVLVRRFLDNSACR